MWLHGRGFRWSIEAFFIIWGTLAAGRAQGFGGGTGEPNDPYQIATAEQLVSIGSDPNLPGGRVFTRAVIAPNTNDVGDLFEGTSFTGRFDGKSHTIRNLTIRAGGRAFLGLFGSIGRGGQVRGLHVKDASISGTDSCRCLGLLAGYIEQCTIINCSVTGRVTGGSSARALGGLVGFVWFDGRILQCAASCNVSGGDRSIGLGGLAGDNGGEIANCCASGTLSNGPGSADLGGLVGRNSPAAFEPEWTGAFSPGSIIHCYSVVRLARDPTSEEPGGLVGREDKYIPGAIDGYWDMEASGVLTSAGGLGLWTTHMQYAGTYGWDFVGERENGTADLWLIPGTGSYPVLTTLSNTPSARQLAGTGTADDPYRIATAEDLGAICHYDASACYRLMNDIDLTGIRWSTAPICTFDGRFDGAGFVISHLSVYGHSYLGLFDSLGPNASVTNLRVVANIVGDEDSQYVAALVGRGEGLVSGCHVSGGVAGEDSVAGLVGYNGKHGVITDSHVAGAVSGTGRGPNCAGGLTGGNGGVITYSHASTQLTGGEMYTLGGLVGDNGGVISACYATGRIDGNESLGGLVAWNDGTISDSYASAEIHTREEFSIRVGGLVGINRAKVINSYSVSTVLDAFNEAMPGAGLVGGGWNSSVKGVTAASFWDSQATRIAGSMGGGTELATAQMQSAATFINAGWDFDKTWMICEGKDYPRLRWEGVQCQP
jgi:hypothetical protein